MAIREEITLDISKHKRGIRKARRLNQRYEKSARDTSKQSRRSFKRIGQSAKRWIAGAAAGAMLALGEIMRRISKDQIEFDQKMNESLAIMGEVSMATRNQMERTARTVSEELNISLKEAGESYFFLASAGLDAKESMEALPAVAEFAKAGMFDMATATDLATDAQSALGLTVEDNKQNLRNMRRVTDTLVKANQLANASVQQFSEALTNRGATALRNVNKEIEEGVGVLAAYADQGIKGRRAGMFLSRTLRIMADAANENTKEFKELGIVTAEGNLADFPTIIEALTEELGGLSDTAMTAKLEQMGFTARVQEAIKPLLGLSDQVNEYEKNLNNAGGAAEEVAQNQLKSIQQRAGQVWKSLKNTFGPAFLSMLNSAVNKLGDFSDAMRNATEASLSDTEKLLNTLRRVGGDEELIRDLELQVQLQDAKELKENLKERFQNFSVPVSIATGRNDIGRMVSQVNFEEGAEVSVSQVEQRVDKWLGKMEDLQKRLDKARAEGNKEEQKALRSQITAYEEGITKMRKFISLNKNLADSEKAVAKAKQNVKDRELEKQGIENAELHRLKQRRKQVEKMIEKYQKFPEAVDIYKESLASINQQIANLNEKDDTKQRVSFGTNIDSAKIAKAITLIGDLDKQLQQGDFKDALVTPFEMAKNQVQQYNRALTKANNELDAGKISQQEYEKRVKEATDLYLGRLKEIYNSFKKDLTPAQEKFFEELFGNFEDASDKTGDFGDTLADIPDTADAIINVADAFGGISEQAEDALSGISDVIRSVSKLKNLGSGAGFLDKAIPALGIAGGVASIIGGIVGGDEAQEQKRQRLIEQLSSLEREVERNTQTLREQAVVGSDVSQSQLDEAEGLTSQLFQYLNIAEQGNLFEVVDARVAVTDILDELSNLGIDALEGYTPDLLDSIIASMGDDIEDIPDAIREILEGSDEFEGLEDVLGELTNNLGQFGESLEGAIERFEMTTKLGGDQGKAFDRFIQDVIGLIGPNADNKLVQKLEEIMSADSKEERKALAKELFDLFQKNPELLGEDLTGSDLQEVIDTILSQESPDSTSGSETDGYSRSTQIARTITDVQANEMIMFLERIEKWTRDSAAALGSETAISVNSTGDMMPDLSFPVPLPVMLVNEPIRIEMPKLSGSGGRDISVGDVDIGRDGITDEQIDEIGRRFTRKLKEEIRGKQF